MNPKKAAVVAVIGLIAAALIMFFISPARVIDKRAVMSKVTGPVFKKYALSDNNLTKKHIEIKRRGTRKYYFSFQAYDVPDKFSFTSFAGALKREAEKNGLKLTRSEKVILKNKEIGLFTLGYGNFNLLTLNLAKRRVPAALPSVTKRVAKPRIAIVMDDLGYNTKYLQEIFSLKEPITFAVLPSAPFSAATARLCSLKGYEVVLHLPLESRMENESEERNTIKSSMSDKEILRILDRDLSDVPGAKGVSNHTGSGGTENTRLMTVIMNELKRRGLYFFDSLTSKKSVCAETAANAGVKYAKRDAFLDLPCDIDYIEKQILMARKLAFKRGSVIVVCHYRKNTVRALAKWLPLLRSEGIKFVTLSDMVN